MLSKKLFWAQIYFLKTNIYWIRLYFYGMETKKQYNIIGLMSGTSLDGIDLANIAFWLEGKKWFFELKEFATIPYSDYWQQLLKKAVNFGQAELQTLNEDYTQLLAEVIGDFISDNNLENITAVSSHGHTILHRPAEGLTLQIGNLPILATLINQKVVCDFRVQDVMLGGQGAPLVPIGDELLFSDFDFCLNLGGFSNISFNKDGSRIAFDISAVNTVLNFYSNQLGFAYDNAGKISKTGKLNDELLTELNDLKYYKKAFPKSLGMEDVRDILFPLINSYSIPPEDKMRTFVEHIAFQIAAVLPARKHSMLITGGGVYNEFLIERLKWLSPNSDIVIPEPKIIEFKEALIFAFLGLLKLRGEINVLSSVTGAKRDHSSGNVFE